MFGPQEVGGMYFASYSDDDRDAWRASRPTGRNFGRPMWLMGTGKPLNMLIERRSLRPVT
jgi:hypothetical protein